MTTRTLGSKSSSRSRVGAAFAELVRRRLVSGGSAMDGRGDVAVFEGQAVVRRRRVGLGSKPRAVERVVEEVSRAVAGEHAAGAVGSVGARREADDEQARRGVAERRDGLAPVVPAAVRAALYRGNPAAVGDQAGAALAGDDVGLKLRQFTPIRLRLLHRLISVAASSRRGMRDRFMRGRRLISWFGYALTQAASSSLSRRDGAG